jgi:threonylcarbamoyladenosine tRNA methylthiotransferase MtaB
VALTTLGCKVNQADSDGWLRQFVARGYEIVDFDGSADAYVVNTCTVTHVADRKSRQLLRQARRQNPAALVVATGCYASVAPDDVARMVEVDLVIGDKDKPRLVEIVHERLEGEDEQPLEVMVGALRTFGPRHRAFVKIADGCDKFCSFCIVPYARGRARSAPSAEVVSQVARFAATGYREVVLTAVHMGSYGLDLTPSTTLAELVRRVLAETPVERLRLSSIEPEDFDREMLALWRDQRLCRHFHLALDSGCDDTLRRMRRRYAASEYRDLVNAIRRAIPDVAITTDVMVGFPGETDAEFETSAAFVADQGFAAIHVFPYSSRRRTTASKLPDHVIPEVKQRRTELMLDVARRSAESYRRRFLGAVVPVLYEGAVRLPDGGQAWEGLTDTYIRVRAPSSVALTNRIVPTRLIELSENGVVGAIDAVDLERDSPPTFLPLPVLTSSSR